MAFQIRPITPDELPAFLRTIAVAFFDSFSDTEIESERDLFEFDRSLAAFEGEQIAGTTGAASFSLTVPGPARLPAAGIAYVSVLPSYRRRGLLRSLMRRQLDDLQERGKALAVLYASESTIYGRFGYGIATDRAEYRIERAHAAFARPVPSSGTIAMLSAEQAADMLPPLHDSACAVQPGALNRPATWWPYYLRQGAGNAEGNSPRYYVTYTAGSGEAEGYATYRIKKQWQEGMSRHTLTVGDFFALTPQATVALWDYLLRMDLVHTVTMANRPIDEPLRWLLADPRRLQTTARSDGLWLRLVDIPAALEARRYARPGSLVFGVTDRFRPQQTGAYRLEGGPEGAQCRRTNDDPDLILDVADLGGAYLGGMRFDALARAGRVVEARAGALRRADTMFASDRSPWCGVQF